jgi:integrase
MPYDLAPFRAHLVACSSARTVTLYLGAAERFMAMLGGEVSAITRDSLNDYRNHLHARGLSPASMRIHMAGAKALTSWLADSGCALPELKAPKMPQVKVKAPPALSATDLGRILADAATHVPQPYYAVLAFLPLTGMRVDELCHLEIAQLQLDGGVFVFRGVGGKSKAERDVYLSDDSASYVRDYHRIRKSLPWYTSDNPWMFPTQGGHAEKRYVQEYLREVTKSLGIVGASPHAMRHYWATQAHAGGMSVLAIQKHLGHEAVATTGRYVHAESETMRQSIRTIKTPYLPGRT